MDIEKLKQKVLDLAIRGKLVPQDPNDEPASVLIEKIKKEKEELIKQGKIKPLKNDAYIYKGSDNCYYENLKKIELKIDIPNGWTICKFNDVIDVRDGTHDSPKYHENGIPFVTSKNLKENKIDFSTCKFISIEDANKFNKRSNVDNYDILFAMIGTIGNPVIVKKEKEFAIKNVALFKNINRDLLSEEWVKILLEALTISMIEKTSSGLQPFVSLDFLRNYIILIPPYNEQIKIIKKVNEIYKLINLIKKEKEDISKNINKIKIKILNYFFDENSTYKSYYNDKYNTTLKQMIPKNKIGDGDWVLTSDMDENGEYSLVQLKHISEGKYNKEKKYNHINSMFFKNNNCSEIKENYILINRLIMSSMNVCILPKLGFKTITSVDVCWIAPDNSYNQKYLMYYLLSSSFQNQVLNKSSGSTRKRISKKNLINIPMRIHNIKDQEIIVKKIDAMFEILNLIIS